jgi:predicted amidophosphoribosyltransferase
MSIELNGHWDKGYALDLHTTSSTPIREVKTIKTTIDGKETELQVYGEITGWDNHYTEIGEHMNRLKYWGEHNRVAAIAELATTFLRGKLVEWNLNRIIPVPPSKLDRPFQPVIEISRAIGNLVNIPVDQNSLRKIRTTPQMIGINDIQERRRHLQGAFDIQENLLRGQNVLLIDDLYRSGETLNSITDILKLKGKATRVYVLTITKTRSNR